MGVMGNMLCEMEKDICIKKIQKEIDECIEENYPEEYIEGLKRAIEIIK